MLFLPQMQLLLLWLLLLLRCASSEAMAPGLLVAPAVTWSAGAGQDSVLLLLLSCFQFNRFVDKVLRTQRSVTGHGMRFMPPLGRYYLRRSREAVT